MQARTRLAEEMTHLARALTLAVAEPPNTFGAALVAWLRQYVRFDHCVVFGYRGAMRPPMLFETFLPEESLIYVALYQKGPYLLDPFHHAALDRREGFWRMRELAPDRFYTSEYYRSYYSQTGLAEEVGFFIPIEASAAVVVSLMRLKASGPFGTADVRQLRDLAPVVVTLGRLRWPRLEWVEARHSCSAHALPPHDFDRARIWDSLGLTPREGQVVDHVLQGHSTESAARMLGISAGTTKVHRRNIHRKLGVRSQAELFARFVALYEEKQRGKSR